jgi:gamma-aminobutyric acid type B receptor
MQVIEVIRHPRDKAESKYNPDVGMTKEDEERYQKLVAENEELQKLISAVRLFIFYFFTCNEDCGMLC